MYVTRAADVPTKDMDGTRMDFCATPENGASETLLLRGVVKAGSSFPPHSHDREEVLLVLSGRGTYTIGDEQGEVAQGDVVVIPAGVLHVFSAVEDLDAIGVVPTGTKMFAPDGSEVALQ
jgi:quercetin dioxygenase-like cupin family protein